MKNALAQVFSGLLQALCDGIASAFLLAVFWGVLNMYLSGKDVYGFDDTIIIYGRHTRLSIADITVLAVSFIVFLVSWFSRCKKYIFDAKNGSERQLRRRR